MNENAGPPCRRVKCCRRLSQPAPLVLAGCDGDALAREVCSAGRVTYVNCLQSYLTAEEPENDTCLMAFYRSLKRARKTMKKKLKERDKAEDPAKPAAPSDHKFKYKIEEKIKKEVAKRKAVDKIKNQQTYDEILKKFSNKLRKCEVGVSRMELFQCNVCRCVYPYRQRLEQHMLESSGCVRIAEEEEAAKEAPKVSADVIVELPKRYNKKYVHKSPPKTCDHCSETFVTRVAFFKHLRDEHPSDGRLFRFHCETCATIFASKKMYVEHMRERHPDFRMNRFACDVCKTELPSKKNLHGHLKLAHPNDERLCRFACVHCPQRFRSKILMFTHLKEEHPYDSRLFRCEMCGKVFEKQQNLKRHVKDVHSVTDATFKCELCLKLFKNGRYLAQHTRQLHPLDDSIVHKCETCDKVFNIKRYLLKHMRVMHEHRPIFTCAACPKKFLTQKALKKHVILKHLTSENGIIVAGGNGTVNGASGITSEGNGTGTVCGVDGILSEGAETAKGGIGTVSGGDGTLNGEAGTVLEEYFPAIGAANGGEATVGGGHGDFGSANCDSDVSVKDRRAGGDLAGEVASYDFGEAKLSECRPRDGLVGGGEFRDVAVGAANGVM